MNLGTKNKGYIGAYVRGHDAFLRGHLRIDCPYEIAPCHRRNGGTWGAVWRNYWLRGYDDAARAQQEDSRNSA